MRPSTRDPDALPPPAALERLCRRLALLDAVLSPVWDFRYYSFDGSWDPEIGQRLGSMRNGQGDEWFAVFQEVDGRPAVFLRGFAHGAPVRNPPGLYEGVPEAFRPLTEEVAFGDDATFCLWNVGHGWQRGPDAIPAGGDPDGSAELLAILVDDPVAYKAFALDYHERDVPLEALRRIYADEPLSDALVAAIAPERSLADLEDDLDEMGR
jgi:hypothetical protein